MTTIANGLVTIHNGNAPDVLRSLDAESVQCCVTSPPYFGLRDYGTDPVDWPAVTFVPVAGLPPMTIQEWRGSLGLEPDPWMFVAHLVYVFREVRRVLRDDGVLWLNLGDSYAGGGGTSQPHRDSSSGGIGRKGTRGEQPYSSSGGGFIRPNAASQSGIKPKDLLGIPWRVAFALQADGWWLRSDVIWHKPNPMPESVTDRPTKAHEYVFMLAKSARYWYDAEAVREDPKPWNNGIVRAPKMGAKRIFGAGKAGVTEKKYAEIKGANRRSVWTISTRPYGGAHFATMPPELAETCILAGCPDKCCPTCGKGWERAVERTKYEPPIVDAGVRRVDTSRGDKTRKLSGSDYNRQVTSTTIGHSPACACPPAAPVPGVVLDPFGGSGTTAEAAVRLGRRAVLIDLNGDYLRLQTLRVSPSDAAIDEAVDTLPLFVGLEATP